MGCGTLSRGAASLLFCPPLARGIGTFLSIYFGDEMLDVATHRDRAKHHRHGMKYRIIATLTLFLLALLAYYYLLDSLDITWDS